jgi:hypothetical protein
LNDAVENVERAHGKLYIEMRAIAKGFVLRLTASTQSNAVPLLIDNTIHGLDLDFSANPERTG